MRKLILLSGAGNKCFVLHRYILPKNSYQIMIDLIEKSKYNKVVKLWILVLIFIYFGDMSDFINFQVKV